MKKEQTKIVSIRASTNREAVALKKVLAESQAFISEVELLIKGLELESSITLRDIQRIKGKHEATLRTLRSILDEVGGLETGIEALRRSAPLAKSLADLQRVNEAVEVLRHKERQLRKWMNYFGQISENLRDMEHAFLKRYISKYGSLTSNIQRRLRTVYGFGGIELHAGKERIAVRVERQGQTPVPPSDYYSESQLQIVMLSLFMSAALTQNWSAFGPILLDDPVTHFDDLNAYSFLDLIRGLILDPKRKHQFIISTCEERLFRLMRQKFSQMDAKVLFYTFDSIGEKGPNFHYQLA